MAHQRTASSVGVDALKEPHPVSLKVLRLSRPSLATQYPLPSASASSPLAQFISPAASLACPPSRLSNEDNFILSPLLTLPPAFGNAYVGETFACTLCANNELLPTAEPMRQITGVRIEAEMKTPSSTYPLDVALASKSSRTEDTDEKDDGIGKERKARDLDSGESVQGIVEFHLKEEGSHVLAVTISYTENSPTSGRVRTFRKLYQFVAKGCLIVRTKIGVLPGVNTKLTRPEGNKESRTRKRWALEAQLENSGDDLVVLDSVSLEEKPWCKAIGLNWERGAGGTEVDEMESEMETPSLGPKDIQQICFLVEQVSDEIEEDEAGRLIMGMLHISWRGAMGNRGSLSTNWLGARFR